MRIVAHNCHSAKLRVAPIEQIFNDQSSVLMHVHSPFVLMMLPATFPRAGNVYVPVALARHLLEGDSGARVVWRDAGNATDAIIQQSIANMWKTIPYDMYITVNAVRAFAMSDSECTLVSSSNGRYSLVSSMLHEMFHGMGIYSVIERERSGGLGGHLSVFDSLVQNQPGVCERPGCYTFDQENVHHTTGNDLAGTPIWIGQTELYNSIGGSGSLSHILDPAAVMAPELDHSKCKFTPSVHDLNILNKLGWECNTGQIPFEWDVEDMITGAPLGTSNASAGISPSRMIWGICTTCVLFLCTGWYANRFAYTEEIRVHIHTH